MTVFYQYANYYDLLYRDKDSAGEADYVIRHIRKFNPEAKSILEIGCGTGRHSRLLAGAGFEVTGVDLSESMIAIAGQRGGNIEFRQGDVRTLQLGRRFDVVIALFHVMSYVTENADLTAAFSHIAAHLEEGGVFLFDFWYGPAVLTQRPEHREKVLEDDRIGVRRLARPEVFYNRNVVDVHYDLAITDRATGQTESVQEVHSMRYFFLPEIRQFLQGAGMKLLGAEEWMTAREPGPDTWGVFCGAALA